jgi:hypothetical protein
MKRSITLAILLLCYSAFGFAATGCDGSGNCYVRAGATGTGTGSSWTNAYTGFGTGAGQINPASMSRGVIYSVASGNYGTPTFREALHK